MSVLSKLLKSASRLSCLRFTSLCRLAVDANARAVAVAIVATCPDLEPIEAISKLLPWTFFRLALSR